MTMNCMNNGAYLGAGERALKVEIVTRREQCQECGKLVRDKPIIGTMHICAPTAPR